ncbi:MAG: HEAT repeat domain-containing protein [Deltaproteobacteria bacterium]|nr:MAG: HEAT repeat domain-containing protein [Deltaproteobacteria bacterium]
MQPLAERLEHRDPRERRAACAASVDDPAAEALVPALGRALGDPEKDVSRAASDALARLSGRCAGVGPVLNAALRSDEPRRRLGAALTLARIAPPGAKLIPPLVEALSSPDGDVRWAAARRLVEAGRLHREVLPLLLGLARSGEAPGLRRMAAFCVRKLAPERPESARALLAASRDDDRHVRRAALTAMAALLAPPTELWSRLLAVLRTDPDAVSRRIAAATLGELAVNHRDETPDAVVPALREARRARDPDLERIALRALARLGPEAARDPSAGAGA